MSRASSSTLCFRLKRRMISADVRMSCLRSFPGLSGLITRLIASPKCVLRRCDDGVLKPHAASQPFLLAPRADVVGVLLLVQGGVLGDEIGQRFAFHPGIDAIIAQLPVVEALDDGEQRPVNGLKVGKNVFKRASRRCVVLLLVPLVDILDFDDARRALDRKGVVYGTRRA